MPVRISCDDLVKRLAHTVDPRLIAIDGLPCSGKSTLAATLHAAHGFECLYLDDFVRPEREWPSRNRPEFPFGFVRYDEFTHAIRTLATSGQCVYAPFDWDTLTVSTVLKTVTLKRPVIIEGVSTLNPFLTPLYGLKIFVDSDRSTTLAAAQKRGIGEWFGPWRDLFLPSADLYMDSRPELRADLIVLGRGANTDD